MQHWLPLHTAHGNWGAALCSRQASGFRLVPIVLCGSPQPPRAKWTSWLLPVGNPQATARCVHACGRVGPQRRRRLLCMLGAHESTLRLATVLALPADHVAMPSSACRQVSRRVLFMLYRAAASSRAHVIQSPALCCGGQQTVPQSSGCCSLNHYAGSCMGLHIHCVELSVVRSV